MLLLSSSSRAPCCLPAATRHQQQPQYRRHSSPAAKRARSAPPPVLPASTAAAAANPATTTNPASPLVDRVLTLIANSDGGVSLPPDQREEVDTLLERLADEHGRQQHPRPLDDPLLVGDYDVAYTSTSRAQQERGQPAGGRFRGRLGRALFRTTGVFQSVLPLPEGEEGQGGGGNNTPSSSSAVALAVNKVSFRLFGLIPGYVGLRGRCYPCARPRPPAAVVGSGQQPAAPDTSDDNDRSTVRVLFEPPVLALGPVVARIGPPSSVVLTTTYLDDRVRLGRGSRGSLFVFKRGGAASEARMAEVGAEAPSVAGKICLAMALGALLLGGAVLWRSGAILGAAALWLVAASLAAITYRGGIERDDEEIARRLGRGMGSGGGGGGGGASSSARAGGASG